MGILDTITSALSFLGGGNGTGDMSTIGSNSDGSPILNTPLDIGGSSSSGGSLLGGKDLLSGLSSLSIPALLGYSSLSQGNLGQEQLDLNKQNQADQLGLSKDNMAQQLSEFNQSLSQAKELAMMDAGTKLKAAKLVAKVQRESLLQNAYNNLANAAFTGGTNEAQALQTIGAIGQNAASGAKR